MDFSMSVYGTDEKIVLNEYQRAAVEDESRACLVKANVGSGKTTVLVEKLRRLYGEKKIPYERMVVLTFTNKAANEIMERLGAASNESAVQGVDFRFSGFGTFHSVALSFLREKLPVEKLGYKAGFAVIDPDEEVDLALSLIETHGLQIKYKNRLKKRLEQEEKAWRQGREQSRLKDDLFLLFPLLEKEKVRLNRFSFSDLIRVAAKLLFETASEEKPEWIIVDEVQDSDRQQLEFLSALMGEHTHLFAVGDPNQVIYSWRGGAENIFYLLSHWFDARELTLPVNYRSNAAILDAARCFQQSGERLQGTRQGGKPVQVRNHYDPFSEAQYLAGRITGLIADGVSPDEIGVFYRLQNQAELLEKEFSRSNIPYQVSLKRSASDIPVIRWLIRLLRYACDPQDHSSAMAVLTDKTYGPGLTVRKARAVVETLGDEAKTAELTGKAERAAAAFLKSVRELKCQKDFTQAQELYCVLKLDEALNPVAASYPQEREWVMEFLERALAEQAAAGDICTVLNTFLTSSALYGLQLGAQKNAAEANGKSVHLMTLHASKGLEFRYVFIIGVNYGLIPLTSGTESDEEEERRLFFVGMTRAKDYLELSWYTNPGMPRVAPGESRYLSMIPAHLLCRDEQTEQGKADLTAMRRAAAKLREERGKELAEESRDRQQPEENHDRQRMEESCDRQRPEDRGTELQKQRVRHARYGLGTVLEEIADKIKVQFDTFGEKEFMKAFIALERVEE